MQTSSVVWTTYRIRRKMFQAHEHGPGGRHSHREGWKIFSVWGAQAMVSMVMAEVQNMAAMDQDLFRSRFVNVICRIQGLLLQSRESAASQVLPAPLPPPRTTAASPTTTITMGSAVARSTGSSRPSPFPSSALHRCRACVWHVLCQIQASNRAPLALGIVGEGVQPDGARA